MSDDEIQALWFDFGDGDVSRRIWLGLKLLLITGQRRGEVTRAERQEFDVDKKRWLIPAGRRGKNEDGREPGAAPRAIEYLGALRAKGDVRRVWLVSLAAALSC